MSFNVVLFDLDGTLVDSIPLIRKSYQNVFTEMQIQWTDSHMTTLAVLPIKESAKIYAKQRQKEFLTSFFKHYLGEHNSLMKMFPGTVEMLQLLKNHGCRLGIVTSKSRLGTTACLDFLGITDILDVIITDDDATHHKPHPEPLIKALELLSTPPTDALYIGDSHLDIIAAKSAGIKAAYVTWGAGNNDDIQQYEPDYVVENWDELIHLIIK